MTGGEEGAECEGNRGLLFILFYIVLYFFIFFISYICCLRYKKSHGALGMAKQNPKSKIQKAKETSVNKQLHEGSVPVLGPHTGTKIKQVNQGNSATTSGYYKQLAKPTTKT